MKSTILKRGARGADVKVLQSALNCIPDGIFGPITEEAVKAFKQASGLVVDGIAGPKTLAALGLVDGAACHQVSRRIDKVIVHCTDTPEGREVTVDQVRSWHVKDHGFADIGYHYLIGLDGTVHEGRPLDKVGAHCLGQNTGSVGICYVGGRGKDGRATDTRTPSQRNALRSLVGYFKEKYGCTVHGHYEFAAKACPCFKIEDL